MDVLIAKYQARKAELDGGLHDSLRAAIAARRVEFYTDPRMLDFQGSPVHSPWDHLGPLLVLMMLALALLLGFGVAVGIVAMTLCVFTHLYGNKYYAGWRLRLRTRDYMLESAAHWQAVWHLGGVALVLKGSSEPPCLAPKGDWRKFTRRNLGENAPAPTGADAGALPPPPSKAPPAPPPVQEVIPPAPEGEAPS